MECQGPEGHLRGRRELGDRYTMMMSAATERRDNARVTAMKVQVLKENSFIMEM